MESNKNPRTPEIFDAQRRGPGESGPNPHRRRWGWWASLLIDLGVASALVFSAIDDGWNNVDWELILLIPVFVILVVWLLLPGVRRFYRGSSGPEWPPPAMGSPSL